MKLGMYRVWSIIYNSSGKDHHIGSFVSRKKCIEFLKYLEQEHFFKTGSMEEAERQWGLKNFRFEQTLLIPQMNIFKIFEEVDLNGWNMDL